MIVIESFGRGLVLEPYFATVILGGGLPRRTGGAALLVALVPRIPGGKSWLAFAHVERHSRYDVGNVTTTAHKGGTSFVLDGRKSVILHRDCADRIHVTVRVSGGPRGRDGVGLFPVDAASPGKRRRGYATQDGLRAPEVTLADVRVDTASGLSENALATIDHVIDEALAALCAEAVGTMQVMHDLPLE